MPSRSSRLVIGIVATGVVLYALYFALAYAPAAHRQAVERVEHDLTLRSDERVAAIDRWLADGLADVAALARFPTAVALADGDASGGGASVPDPGAHLDRIFQRFAEDKRLDRVFLVGGDGTILARSSGAISPACLSTARARAQGTERSAVDVHVHDNRDVAVQFATSVGTIGAVAVTEVSADQWLCPFALRSPLDMSTAEAVLVRRAGDQIVAICGPRSALGERFVARPAATPRLAGAAALDDRPAFGQYRDYRAQEVFAAIRRLRPVRWGLVAKVDHAEVMAGVRRELLVHGAATSALVLAVGLLGLVTWRGRERAHELALARSRARQAALVDRANDAILVVTMDGRILEANERACGLYGRPREALIGLHVVEALRAEDAREAAQEQYRAVAERGQLVFQTVHVSSDGTRIPVEVSSSLVEDDTGPVMVSVVRDVRERHAATRRIERLNRVLRTLSEVNQLLIASTSREHLLESTCRVAVEQGGFELAWIGRASDNGAVVPVAVWGEDRSYVDRIEVRWDDSPLAGSPIGRAIRERRTVAMAHVAEDPAMAPWQAALASTRIQSSAASPIVVRDRVFGSLNLYSSEPDAFDPETVALLAELAGDVGFGIQAYEDREQRAATETALAEQRRLLERITDLSPALIYLFDVEEHRNVYSNRMIAEVVGYAPAEIAALGPAALPPLLHPDDLTVLTERMARFETAADGDVVETEYRMRHKDGEFHWLFSHEVVFTRLAGGRPKLVLGTAQDITERKRMEEALRAGEEQFRTVFDSAAMGIVLTDPGGRIMRANQAFARMLTYGAEQLVGRSLWELAHPDDRARELPLATEMNAGGRDRYQLDTRYVASDGREVWASLTVSLVRSAIGTPVYAVALVEDITERRRLQEQFFQAQKMEGIGRLAGGVAHDFNNLLTAIIGYAEMLQAELPEDAETRAYADEISKAGSRAAALTGQLLAFARRQVIAPRVLDLNAVVADAERMLRRLVGEDVEIVTVADPDLARVSADPGQIHQVLVNLAVNARDAMPQGGRLIIETANVTLDERYARARVNVKPGQYVMLAVSDTGGGMTAEVREHLFEPFFTTKEPGKGTGLGLATCHGIVTQNGGHIGVYSEVGLGTTFRVYLPRATEAEREERPQAPSPLRGGTETVLLAEDEPAVRHLAALSLRSHGYRVLDAEDGQAALELAREHAARIGLLVTDVVMPGLGGRALAERFREVCPAAPVLFVSGHAESAIAHHGVLEPGVAFLPKPFTPERLARRVREVLDGD